MVIDRIEGDVAVVEVSKGEFVDVPVSLIEGRVRDGAVLAPAGGSYLGDEAATKERRERLGELRRRIFGER